MKVSKQARKQLNRVEAELGREYKRQTYIVYGSAAIALHENWGWRQVRIRRILDLLEEVWNECARNKQTSIIQMLDEETGIELRLRENGRSYKEFDFLNGKLSIYDLKTISIFQMIRMRQGEVQWLGASIQAALYLALARRYGFGAERIQRLLTQMFEVQDRLENDPERILGESLKLTGVDIRYRTGHASNEEETLTEEDANNRINWIDEVKEELRKA